VNAPAATPAAAGPRQVTVSPEAAESFDRKIAQFDRTPVAGGARQLVLTESEVTSKLAQVLSTSTEAPPVRNLQVRLDPGVIEATGRVDFGFGQPEMLVRSQLAVNNGVVEGRIERIALAGLPVPQGVQNQIIAAVLGAAGVTAPPGADLTDFSNLRLPADVRTLQVRQGDLLIELRP
jgi:hypothetical protein